MTDTHLYPSFLSETTERGRPSVLQPSAGRRDRPVEPPWRMRGHQGGEMVGHEMDPRGLVRQGLSHARQLHGQQQQLLAVGGAGRVHEEPSVHGGNRGAARSL